VTWIHSHSDKLSYKLSYKHSLSNKANGNENENGNKHSEDKNSLMSLQYDLEDITFDLEEKLKF